MRKHHVAKTTRTEMREHHSHSTEYSPMIINGDKRHTMITKIRVFEHVVESNT